MSYRYQGLSVFMRRRPGYGVPAIRLLTTPNEEELSEH